MDTDADDLADALQLDPTNRFGPLDPEEVFPAQLHRAAHYMKPRLSGRTLTEGWFDPQLLYKIPRSPQTMGLRMFGRLAFCDHYRPLMGKIHAALETAVAADAMTRAEDATGLLRRTNRPRVYIAAGLGGGTGSGMLLDMAYAVRNRLKRMGYEKPEVIGVLMAPQADPTLAPPQAIANTYAALTELNHYSRLDTTFAANYDERHGSIHERDAPFTRYYVIPGPAKNAGAAAGTNGSHKTNHGQTPVSIGVPGSRVISQPGSRVILKPGSRVMPNLAAQLAGKTEVEPTVPRASLKTYGDAADLIRLNLFTSLGRTIDEARDAEEAETVRASSPTAFGVTGFGWPRGGGADGAQDRAAVMRRWRRRTRSGCAKSFPGWHRSTGRVWDSTPTSCRHNCNRPGIEPWTGSWNRRLPNSSSRSRRVDGWRDCPNRNACRPVSNSLSR